jgi:hypothetical protein
MFTATTTSGFTIIPNPRLRAEKAWSYEIGINQILSENILIGIAAFHNDYQNFIEPDRDEQNTVMFVNVPRARIRGVEMTAQSSWWKRRINTSISYTYLDPKYISRDNTFWWWLEELAGKNKPDVSYSEPLAYRPKHLFTCSVSLAYGNFEVRWKFFETTLWRQDIYLALSPFTDMGIVTKKYNFSTENVPDDVNIIADKEKLHISYGASFNFALNHNFILCFNYGRAVDKRDGNSGLYITVGYLF